MAQSAIARRQEGSVPVGGNSVDAGGGRLERISRRASARARYPRLLRADHARRAAPTVAVDVVAGQPGVLEQRFGNGTDRALEVDMEASQLGLLLPDVPSSPALPTLHALQEWEGYVTEVGEEEFEACLLDVTAGARYPNEEATIPFDEISHHDRDRMQPGSIFRWVIGYEKSPAGTKKRVSQIVFRDLPVVTEADFREGRKWAEEIAEKFEL